MQSVRTASCAGLLFRCAPNQPLLQALGEDRRIKNSKEKKMKESSTPIIVALIGAIASIAAALISSGYFAEKSVKENIRNIEIGQKEIWETKSANKEYLAQTAGIVVAVAHADPENRAVYITGKINGEDVAATSAQDSTVEGVPSILNSSLSMPVPKGASWSVDINNNRVSQVHIKWFATTSEIVLPK